MPPEILKSIKELLSHDQLEEALALIINTCEENSSKTKEAILILRRLNELKKAERENTINRDDAVRERSRIRKAIIELINEEDEKNSLKGKNTKETLGIIISVVIAISFFIFFIIIMNNTMKGCADLGELLAAERELARQKEEALQQQKENKSSQKSVLQHEGEYDYLIFDTQDDAGNQAEYILYIVNGFNWKIGEVAVSEEYGVEFDICSHLEEIGIIERINSDSLKAIICFGNTSFEEDQSVPYEQRISAEEQRAQKRAEKLAICVNRVLKKFTPVYTLNLGKYMLESDISDWQRQILIIGLLRREKFTNENEALYNGLVKEYVKGNLKFNIIVY